MTSESVMERRMHRRVCGIVFVLLLATYWLTTPDSVSYWDCPEYVSAAYLLEIGHPPGNPVWMLAEHIVTLLSGPEHAAYAVNLYRLSLGSLLRAPRCAGKGFSRSEERRGG